MNKKNYIYYILVILMFFSIAWFFTNVCPIVPYDGDDWANLSYLRAPIPKWGIWNPIKVFPETLMPMVGHIAAYLFYPITEDYIYSITISSACIVSLFITSYFVLLNNLIENKFNLTSIDSLVISSVIFLLHFLVFVKKSYQSQYMFYSPDLTCYFHYVVPALLNCVIVMYMMLYKNKARLSYYKFGILLLGLYLAIFSNLFSSIILVAYVSFVIIERVYLKIINKENMHSFISNNTLELSILLAWVTSLVFEANGGRSEQIGVALLDLPIQGTFTLFLNTIKCMNKYFITVYLLSVIGFVFLLFKKKIITSYKKILLSNIWCIIVTSTYLILVSAKVSVGYITRSDVLFGLFFYIFLLLAFMISNILKNVPLVKILVPILFFILCGGLVDNRTFRYSTTNNVEPSKCVLVDNYLIYQIKKAYLKGKEEMILVVPKGDDRDNWPHPYYMGENIVKTLKAHGIIDRDIKITIKPDNELNKKYGL